MYKYILFDLDDTLIDFSSSQQAGLQEIHRKFYKATAYAEFELLFKSINNQLWKQIGAPTNALKPNDIRLMRFENINQQLNMDLSPTDIAHEYETTLGESAQWLPGVESAIKYLHEKGHILGIITNGFANVQHRKYERLGFSNWFSSFIVAGRVGLAKPNPEIFKLAFDEIASKTNQSIHKETVLMVGDSISDDGYGAMNAGIDFCLINEKTMDPIPEDLPIKMNISTVAHLPTHMEMSFDLPVL